MGLLDFDDTYEPPYKAPRPQKTPTEEENASALNNLGRQGIFGEDSPKETEDEPIP